MPSESRLITQGNCIWEFHPEYNVFITLDNKPRLLIFPPRKKEALWGILNSTTGDWSLAKTKKEAFETAGVILARF